MLSNTIKQTIFLIALIACFNIAQSKNLLKANPITDEIKKQINDFKDNDEQYALIINPSDKSIQILDAEKDFEDLEALLPDNDARVVAFKVTITKDGEDRDLLALLQWVPFTAATSKRNKGIAFLSELMAQMNSAFRARLSATDREELDYEYFIDETVRQDKLKN